ncbi:hypothetical protein B0T17DRAFT_536603 [Bombardia bombarda]|uniref:Uncharacterized protein n=1 Tax=Bombardia bombarda TaxID=252184 RepID=A0AA39WM88_9PEZI|nr:hypothetical protein B0T17DRAFT_536603 [Bombardia bombarda]
MGQWHRDKWHQTYGQEDTGRPGGEGTWDGTCDAVSQASHRTQLPNRLGLSLENYLGAASFPRCSHQSLPRQLSI